MDPQETTSKMAWLKVATLFVTSHMVNQGKMDNLAQAVVEVAVHGMWVGVLVAHATTSAANKAVVAVLEVVEV